MSLILQILFALSAVSVPMQSYAVEQEIDVVDDGTGGGDGGGSGGGGTYTPPTSTGGTNTGSGGSTSSGPIRVACLGDNGDIKNASPNEVCRAVLPKCSELKTKVTDRVKEMLSQKIWGYYNGKDVDLGKSSLSNLVGTDMKYSVCSVVGQNIRGNGSDAELKTQSIGKRADCGILPRVEGDGKKFSLHYDGDNGSKWVAYMLGAYPWLIRKNAYDVLNDLSSDLSNLDSVLAASKAMNADFAKTNQQMKDYAKSLSTEAKTACEKQNSNLIADCLSGALSINDPAQRLCTIVKAQLASNESALPNMLAFEVTQRVQKEYDKVFSTVINFDNPTMKALSDECDNTGGLLRSKAKKIAMTGSCFFGGEYCYSGKCATKNARIDVSTGRAAGLFVRNPTRNLGFAAVIEKLIRHDICGQTTVSSPSPKCEFDIPAKPKGVP